jgi:hypothetical protein
MSLAINYIAILPYKHCTVSLPYPNPNPNPNRTLPLTLPLTLTLTLTLRQEQSDLPMTKQCINYHINIELIDLLRPGADHARTPSGCKSGDIKRTIIKKAD